jgi:hypothetical protein
MEDDLARSSPKLASMLTIFSRLTEGEELPVREWVRPAVGDPGTGVAGRIGSGRIRRHLSRAGWQWLWLVAAVALLALSVTVGHGTGKKPCTALRIGACGQAHVPPAVRPAPVSDTSPNTYPSPSRIVGKLFRATI